MFIDLQTDRLLLEELMEKTKTLFFRNGKFELETVVRSGKRTLNLKAEPLIEVTPDLVQIGCMRITPSALKQLVSLSPGIFQLGSYDTKDPNTKGKVKS